MTYQNKKIKYGEKFKIINSGGNFDGKIGIVVGIYAIDFEDCYPNYYILKFDEMFDNNGFLGDCSVWPDCCLENI